MVSRKKAYSIVYLYSEIMPYQTVVYKELSVLGNTINVFYNDKFKQTPYMPEEIQNVSYYPSSNYTKEDLYREVINMNPDVLVVCGWSSKKYLYVARKIRRKFNIPIVCPIDTQFTRRIKQLIGFIISPVYIKSAFTHIWVPGVRQYHFAKRLGYENNRIIFNSLSGDVNKFMTASIEHKKTNYPKNLLFVGRYNEVKGLRILIDVWKSIEDKHGWKIICAGNGPMKDLLESTSDVEVLEFQPQDNLVKIAENCGAFILPSTYEPWALVIHEFAASGLPILASKACGASDHFVIDNYNGYSFASGSYVELRNAIEKFINLTESQKYGMALASRELSQSVTPRLSAMSLLSIIQ